MISKIFETKAGIVTKYLDEFNNEIIIKNIGCTDPTDDKFTLFLPSSQGCSQSCKFCYITNKKIKYQPFVDNTISQFALECFADFKSKHFPTKFGKYLKISFMGAGDPFSNMAIVLENTWEIITRLEFITKGIDGVDFATTLPLNSINNTYDNFNILKELENRLQNNMKIHSNPANKNRFFRVFYSLHSAKQYTRDGLLPNSLPLDTATKLLKNYAGNNADKVVFHQLFIDGVNDSDTEINGLLKFLDNFELFELRVLRLNSINPEFKESPKFDEIIDCLNSRVRVKIAKSIGSEINAACGQIN